MARVWETTLGSKSKHCAMTMAPQTCWSVRLCFPQLQPDMMALCIAFLIWVWVFTGQRSTSDAAVRITGEWSGGRLGTTLQVCPIWMVMAFGTGWLRHREMATRPPWLGKWYWFKSGALPTQTSQTLISGLDTRWTGTSLGEMAGFSMACTHDLTGDNIADLVIGAPYADTDDDIDASGAVYILDGANLGLRRERFGNVRG